MILALFGGCSLGVSSKESGVLLINRLSINSHSFDLENSIFFVSFSALYHSRNIMPQAVSRYFAFETETNETSLLI